jgi:hypothetical protein
MGNAALVKLARVCIIIFTTTALLTLIGLATLIKAENPISIKVSLKANQAWMMQT